MSTLILELPDEHVHMLERVAQQRGTSVNEVVSELVAGIVTETDIDDSYDISQDPLYNIRAYNSEAPADLSQNADHYLYGTTR